MRLYSFLQKNGLDWFILALGAIIAFASIFPEIGVSEYPVNLSKIAGYGVSVIFFFYGVKTSPEKFKHGIANWKMHVVIQLSTFVLFPVLLIALRPLLLQVPLDNLWISIFFLAALPSTVSSSVVMVSIARGNVPAAIFNASVSSLGGIFVTPLWMSLFISASGTDIDTSQIFMKLIFQILIPVFVGSLFHNVLGNFAERFKNELKILDQLIILLIVYTSFCNSFMDNVFAYIQWHIIVLLALGMIFLLFLMMLFMKLISKMLGFSTEDTITVLFCGSKKSLIHGAVISKVMFAGSPILGILLLPIMLYHPFQLLIVSYIAKKYSNRHG